jgi:hypothetical protein
MPGNLACMAAGDLRSTAVEGVELKVDNQSALALMKNLVFHDRSKHIRTRYHFIQQSVEEGEIQLGYVCSQEQLAYLLTKALPKARFEELRAKIGMCVAGAQACDEDINTLATIIPSVEIVGPITRSRAQQSNHQVNSFLCSSTYNIKSRLLPNDLIILRNQGEDHGGQTKHQEGNREPRRRAREGGEPIQFGIAEFESNPESRTISYSN